MSGVSDLEELPTPKYAVQEKSRVLCTCKDVPLVVMMASILVGHSRIVDRRVGVLCVTRLSIALNRCPWALLHLFRDLLHTLQFRVQ